MNKIYKVVWSKVLNNWVVVSEKSKGAGKAKTRSKKRGAMIASTIAMASILGVATAANDEPIDIVNTNQDLGQGFKGRVPQENGYGVDTIGGVIYSSLISGDRSVIFSAPDAKFNAERIGKYVWIKESEIPDHINKDDLIESGGLYAFSPGTDDRYGRKIELEGTAPNTYVGDTIVKENAQVGVGKDANSKYLLGDKKAVASQHRSLEALSQAQQLWGFALGMLMSVFKLDAWAFPSICLLAGLASCKPSWEWE